MLAVGFRFPARIIESLPLWTQKLGGVMAVDFKFQWDSVWSLHERKSWLRAEIATLANYALRELLENVSKPI